MQGDPLIFGACGECMACVYWRAPVGGEVEVLEAIVRPEYGSGGY